MDCNIETGSAEDKLATSAAPEDGAAAANPSEAGVLGFIIAKMTVEDEPSGPADDVAMPLSGAGDDINTPAEASFVISMFTFLASRLPRTC